MSSYLKCVAVFLTALIVGACTNSVKNRTGSVSLTADTIAAQKKTISEFIYGFPTDSFNLISGQVKKNGFLSEILLKHGITMKEIDQVIKNSKNVFDVRKIRSGNDYMLYCDRDSMAKARYLVYEHDPTIFYVFSFNDSLKITPVRKEIKSEIKYYSGTIETSLWYAVKNSGLHLKLVGDLSDICLDS
jgi:uncharacterized DUF497 family protein